jgi:hypothetical protein
MSLMPGAEYVGPIPTSNYANDGGGKIGVAVHVIVGSAASALAEFRSPGAQLSAHFIVCGPGDQWPDGHILQVLDTAFSAYAQAAGNYPPTAYIAVEFAGTPDKPMSAAQMASGAEIIAWAAVPHGFPILGPVAHGTPGITPHCNPNGTPDPNYGNHSCPGTIRLAQMPAMIAAAQGSPPVPPSPPPIQEVNMIARNTHGLGYWCVRPTGAVYAFQGAPVLGPAQHFLTSWGIGTPACPVVGIADDGQGGFTLMADANKYPGQPALYGITADGKYKV